MDNLKRTAENVDRMLDSYKDSNDFALRLYGPTVHLMPPPFWAFRERRRERDLQRRLKAFDLPPIDQDFRWRWYSQYQLFEDASGYIRRRWVCSYGFTLEEYEQFLAPIKARAIAAWNRHERTD
jgi:hypothetical protein